MSGELGQKNHAAWLYYQVETAEFKVFTKTGDQKEEQRSNEEERREVVE